MAAENDGDDLQRGLELLWDTGERPSRGPKPGLSLGGIVEAAIAIADAEGLDGLSMQRLAKELGYTAMSLYRYVPSKEALVTVMMDRAIGRPPDTAAVQGGWRAELELWATAISEVYRRHPWMVEVRISGPPLGPNQLAWFESALRSLEGAGLGSDEMIYTAVFLNSAVLGLVRTYTDMAKAQGETDAPPSGGAYGQALAKLMAGGEFPTLARVVSAGTFVDADPEGDPLDVAADLAFGLHRLLDGIEAHVAAR